MGTGLVFATLSSDTAQHATLSCFPAFGAEELSISEQWLLLPNLTFFTKTMKGSTVRSIRIHWSHSVSRGTCSACPVAHIMGTQDSQSLSQGGCKPGREGVTGTAQNVDHEFGTKRMPVPGERREEASPNKKDGIYRVSTAERPTSPGTKMPVHTHRIKSQDAGRSEQLQLGVEYY